MNKLQVTRKATVLALITFMIVGIALAGNVKITLVLASTNVTGIIAADTTWTKANSPYVLTGPTAVGEGVTLTIEAGTTVNLKNYYIQVSGTLIARGTSSEQIYINGGSTNGTNQNYGLIFTSSSTGWNEQTSMGSIIEYAVFKLVSISNSVKISHSTISDTIVIQSGSPIITENDISSVLIWGGTPTVSKNFIQSGPYVFGGNPIGVTGGSPLIANNTITGSSYNDQYGRTYYIHDGINLQGSNNAYITDNVISGFFDDAGISITGGTATIQNNTINSAIGISISGSNLQLTIIYNNIVSNSYTISLATQSNINATYNWWGTTDAQAINQSIYDFKNDFNLGKVNFIPILNEPNSEATPSLSTLPQNTQTPSPSTTATPTSTYTPAPTESQTSPSAPNHSPSASQNPAQLPQQSSNQFSEIALAIIGVCVAIIVVLVVLVARLLRRK
jgi:hypothetical protein